MGSAHQLEFWDSGTCPYAHRAWIALVEKQLPYELHKVDLDNKSEEFKSVYASINPDPSARAKVPILIDGDKKVIESMLVVEYLDDAYPDSGTRLLPSDPYERYEVKLFAEIYSSAMMHFTSLILAENPEQLEAAKQKIVEGLKVVDTMLRTHGSEDGGSFFLGARYSYAETVTTPFLRRLVLAAQERGGLDVVATAKQLGLDRLERWIQATLSRESNKKTGPTDAELVEHAEHVKEKIKAMRAAT